MQMANMVDQLAAECHTLQQRLATRRTMLQHEWQQVLTTEFCCNTIAREEACLEA